MNTTERLNAAQADALYDAAEWALKNKPNLSDTERDDLKHAVTALRYARRIELESED